MKRPYLNLFVILVIACLLLPFAAVGQPKTGENSDDRSAPLTGNIKVYVEQTKKTLSLSKKEYLTGVLFAEISPTYNDEAIKAQAVAAYTFLQYRRENAEKDAAYDITDNPENGQGYMSPDTAKETFGDQYEAYKLHLESLIDAVQNYVITYSEKPICAMYHAVSGGKTESAENIYGGSYPYLIAVESVGDLLCPAYLSTATFKKEEVKQILQNDGKTIGEGAAVFSGEDRSPSGTILSIQLYGNTYKGTEVRKLFSLNSANFDVEEGEDSVTFRVRGKGHGVGMSQYGANYMASLGSTFLEILSWYYPGCEMKNEA
ncbi:MAG: SpoIID/LytB domain-containing protein [Candidatus Howiella sp.]|jgi:stage II sporulation protein D